MSAPRPYETSLLSTSPVHSLCHDQLVYIYKTVPVISSMCMLHRALKHCTFFIYACAFPKALILIIWRWRSQRANFASLRKETVLQETHNDCHIPSSIEILFKLLSNFLRRRRATLLSKVYLDFAHLVGCLLHP